MMSLNSENVLGIYTGKLASKYDFSMPHSFNTWKKKAIGDSSLKAGDTVLVFCCGTGSDFPHILKRIGDEGKIIGVDFSSEMLKKAAEKIEKQKWNNIELIEADVTKFSNMLEPKADVGICTLGLSIIPKYKIAYSNLLSNIKPNGELIIGDMQLASGRLARLNPLTIFLSKRYGGTHEGHKNSLELQTMLQRDLIDLRKREFFLKAYYYCIGNKK